MEIKRRRFQGVFNILSFNRHFYVYGLLTLLSYIAIHFIYGWPIFLFWIAITAFSYGLVMPLIVSAYVYDFSGFYHFDWVKLLDLKDVSDQQILNINAGFDETSFILKSKFPLSDLKVFDFYNATQHTEPAIIRARKVSMIYPNTQQIYSNSFPIKSTSVDIIFLLSSAHEIRSHSEKISFLQECHRVLKPEGNIIMIEHLRDFPNFVAFTIGFTHFFSKKTWKMAFTAAGFSTFEEQKFTPFMSIFKCNP
ncbi:MAG: hypothetical protein RLZZ546_2877 [Bacteroidota bacterium]|jgi:SAM-dependent methyltransferase